MSNRLEGRVAAITGASSGIGAATARAFAAAGMAVSLAARREERLHAVTADIVAAGGRALPVVADVTDETAMRTFVTRTLAAFGRLDAIVCNAGIGFYGTMDETSSAVMRRLMDVNFMGTFHAVRAALPYFEQQGHGHVLIVSSILGRRGIPFSAAYAATKFAQVGLAEAVRSEYAASGIAVTVVYPVHTDTELRQTMRREHGVLVRGRGPRQTADHVAQTLVRRPASSAPGGLSLCPGTGAGGDGRRGAAAGRSAGRKVWPLASSRPGRRCMSDAAAPVPIDPVSTAIAVSRLVASAGGRALIVGGWVRDRLLGLPSKDVDLEVFGLDAGALARLLETVAPVNTVGESFTVYKVADLDVSIPRRESKTGPGHRGFAVTGDPSMSFEEAARRRDFTINAIAWDPLRDEYLDPFHGRDDLGARRLRMVDRSTFADDSLRVLRALQFAARFEATLERNTFEMCRTMPLDDLPAERVWGNSRNSCSRPTGPRSDSRWLAT